MRRLEIYGDHLEGEQNEEEAVRSLTKASPDSWSTTDNSEIGGAVN
jgi:hypothetical protein